jgi:hypothetical protein
MHDEQKALGQMTEEVATGIYGTKLYPARRAVWRPNELPDRVYFADVEDPENLHVRVEFHKRMSIDFIVPGDVRVVDLAVTLQARYLKLMSKRS